jgi:hypothetical protein
MICDKCKEPIKQVRSSQQNRSLHKYFTLIAQELNELGQEFCYTGITGKELSLQYTPTIIKELFWKEIQFTMFGTSTTTKLTTEQMNMIIEVFSKFFAERGVNLDFPSIDSIELEK